MSFTNIILLLLNLLISARAEQADGVRVAPRIYGGEERTQQQLGGYAVQIYLRHKLVCSGGLLSHRYVVSAAHCFGQAEYDNYHVIAGETEQRNYFGSTDRKNRVLRLRIHPAYQRNKFIADIAVAAVSAPLSGPTVGYLPLCSSKPAPGSMATVSGWGSSEYSQVDNPLRVMQVPIIAEQQCNQKMERQMPENVVCAAGYNKRTICNGDSGAPLVINGQLCGVSTWTWKCGNDEMPDVYMSVYFYRDFITKCMKEMYK